MRRQLRSSLESFESAAHLVEKAGRPRALLISSVPLSEIAARLADSEARDALVLCSPGEAALEPIARHCSYQLARRRTFAEVIILFFLGEVKSAVLRDRIAPYACEKGEIQVYYVRHHVCVIPKKEKKV